MSVHALTDHPGFRERPILRRDLERVIDYGRSSIHAFIAEGMPTAGKDRKGRNLFLLSDVERWLDSRNIAGGHDTPHKGAEYGS